MAKAGGAKKAPTEAAIEDVCLYVSQAKGTMKDNQPLIMLFAGHSFGFVMENIVPVCAPKNDDEMQGIFHCQTKKTTPPSRSSPPVLPYEMKM